MPVARRKDGRGSGSSSSGVVGPPRYTRKPYTMEHFGDIRNDPYHWLRDRRNPGVRRLLERENAHTASVYDAYGGTQLSRTLFNEMRARWKEDDASLPYRDRSYWYYTRTVPNADYPVYCRRPVNDRTAAFVQEVAQLWAHDASAPLPPYDDEVVYLDVNLLVKELRLGYVELGEMEVSPDETQLAVALDCSNGKEIYTIFVLDIIDVNYGRWLEEQSELHRSWAAAMLRSKQSIYASPTSALPPQRSPTTPSGARWKGGGTANNNNNNNGSSSSSGRRRGNDNSGSVTSAFQAAAASPTTRTQTQQVAPKHKITRRIDVFDAGGEVLWLNPTALLYVGLDGKMRSCRIIYHDLTALVQAEEADIICYEERDEAFWVGSLCFSADERFAMFSVASGSCAEAYVIPCDARSRRRVSGVPVVRVAVDDDDSKGDESDHKNHGSNGAEKKNSDHCAVYCFAERTSHVDHDIDHHESLFGDGVGAWVVVTTNAPPGPENFRVAYVLDDDVALRGDGGQTLSTVLQWRALFAYDPDISVEGVDFLRDYLLINVRRAAFATELLLPVRTLWKRWRDGSGGRMQPLSLRDDAVDLRTIVCWPLTPLSEVRFPLSQLQQQQQQQQLEEKEEGGLLLGIVSSVSDVSFSTRTWRIVVTHLTVPTAIFACTLEEVEATQGVGATLCISRLCDVAVCGAPYRADEYDATVVWVPSDHAFRNALPPLQQLPTKEPAAVVRVPVYVCWKKALRRKGENPMYLTVYGSYGECCDVEFESERLALLDRGFVWAAAAVRGGGECGIPWRDAGRKLQRATAVNDFLSVSRYLQDTGWCAAGRLVTSGASAGGFVVAAAMNVAPSLTRAVVASVPFVDCLTTLLDPTLPLTVCDWEEFGNPLEDAEAYRLLRAVSPMDNIPPAGVALPHVLLQTAWQDTRVGFWESFAFAARLREREDAVATGRILLHHCEFGAGHGGASGRYERLKEIAREYAFAVLVQRAAPHDVPTVAAENAKAADGSL